MDSFRKGAILKGSLICIIGPDGVGKTTQARLLQKALEKQGIFMNYVWIRWNHRASLPLLGLARLLRFSKAERLRSGKRVVYHYFDKAKPIAVIYGYTFLVDTAIAILFKIRTKLCIGQSLISDRSVYDALVDLAVSTRNPKLLDSFVGRVFLSFASGTNIVLLANSSVLRSRRGDVRDDRDLEQKISFYNLISSRCGLAVIDTQASIAEVHSAIMLAVMQDGKITRR